MLRLKNKKVDAPTTAVLATLQQQVDAEPTFLLQVERARTLWSAQGDRQRQVAFQLIRETLTEMCVGVVTCNYCEGNEAGDIEHIYPKSFFPERTFVWHNYLLACKQCNTGEKLDKCFLLDQQGNAMACVRGTRPAHDKIAFINQRLENPLKLIWLNLETCKFELNDNLTLAQQNKALKTIEILELNSRVQHLVGRLRAKDEYYNVMDRLRRMLLAPTIADIRNISAPGTIPLPDNIPIMTVKRFLKRVTRGHVHKMLYPSVWNAIKEVSSTAEPKWIAIFQTVPEALKW